MTSPNPNYLPKVPQTEALEMHSHLRGTWTSVRPNHVATAHWPPHL